MWLGLAIAVVILVCDQLSKYWIMESLLADANVVIYTSFFNIVRAWNTGVSFSMFNDWGVYGVIILSFFAVVVIGFLFWWLHGEKSRFLQVALGFIIGGALGNVIDRMRFGAVFDFLDVHFQGYHWPAFNVADSFICIGAAMVIVHSLFVKAKVEEK